MKITVRPSGLVKRNKCCGAVCCLLLHSGYLSVLKLVQHIAHCTMDICLSWSWCSTLLQNHSTCQPDQMMSHLRQWWQFSIKALFCHCCRMPPKQRQHHRWHRSRPGQRSKRRRRKRQAVWQVVPTRRALSWRMRQARWECKLHVMTVRFWSVWCFLQFIQQLFSLQACGRGTAACSRSREPAHSPGSARKEHRSENAAGGRVPTCECK